MGLPQCLRARESSIMQVYKTLLGSPRLRDLSFLLHLNFGLSVCAEVFPSTRTSGLIRSSLPVSFSRHLITITLIRPVFQLQVHLHNPSNGQNAIQADGDHSR